MKTMNAHEESILRSENELLRTRLRTLERKGRRLAIFALVGAVLFIASSILQASAVSEHPTPVTFVAVHGAPRTMDLYDTMPDGTKVRQSLGTTVEHPEFVCPKNRHFRLTWNYKRYGSAWAYRERPGQCLRPGPGPVYVQVWRVK